MTRAALAALAGAVLCGTVTFGGKAAPYGFNILHKIAMDTRFDPVRIIATDRLNNRVVHLGLDGELLGVVNDELLLPAAVAIDGDNVIVQHVRPRAQVRPPLSTPCGQPVCACDLAHTVLSIRQSGMETRIPEQHDGEGRS